jgi:hypothetical protein
MDDKTPTTEKLNEKLEAISDILERRGGSSTGTGPALLARPTAWAARLPV